MPGRKWYEAKIQVGPSAGRQKAKAKSRARPKPAQAQSKPMVQPESHKPVDYSRFEHIQFSDDENEQDEQLLPGRLSEGHAGAARVQSHTYSLLSGGFSAIMPRVQHPYQALRQQMPYT